MASLASSRQWWLGLPGSTRIYLIGLLSVGLCILMAVVRASHSIIILFGYTAMLFLGAAVLREAYLWLIAKRDWLPVKLIGGVLAIMAAAVATSAAASTISEATGQDPEFFRYSIAFFAPIAFIPILALLVIILGIVGLPITMLLNMSNHIFLKAKIADLDVLLLVARILGIISLVSGASQLLDPSTGFDATLKSMAARSAFHLDMHRDLLCSSVPGDRVLRLNEQLVIVGRITEQGPRFVRFACPLAAEPTQLPPPAKFSKKKSNSVSVGTTVCPLDHVAHALAQRCLLSAKSGPSHWWLRIAFARPTGAPRLPIAALGGKWASRSLRRQLMLILLATGRREASAWRR